MAATVIFLRPPREELVKLRKEHSVQGLAELFGARKPTIEKWLTYYKIKHHECRYGHPLNESLTDFQLDLITGNMLGDGSIPRSTSKNHSFQFVQSIEKEEYVKYVHDSLVPFSRKTEQIRQIKPCRVNGKVVHNTSGVYSYGVRVRTAICPIFTNLRKQWYKNNKKIVPNNLVLNWRRVAFWFCDDGSNHYPTNRSIQLHTNNFSKNNVDFLISVLKRDLGICGKKNKQEKNYTIRIPSEHHNEFLDNVSKFIFCKCMLYKLSRPR